MASAGQGWFGFEDYRLNEQSRILLRRGETVPLTPKAFETLSVLVRNRGDLVTKDELMKAVWPDSYVQESNLTQTVFVLRKTLGETREKRYIVTVPGRGYRFAPRVREVPGDKDVCPDDTRSQSRHRLPKSTKWFMALGITAVLITALAVYLHRTHQRQRTAIARKIVLAVLPFENLTGDAGQEYFSDGLTDELISRLGSLDPLNVAVIARTSAMTYKNGHVPLNRIRRELGVQYVLEGGVRRDGDRIRISAQLIRADDQTNLWARQYDRPFTGILAVQGEIAQSVSDEIQLTLINTKQFASANPPLSKSWFEAYDLYLKGRYYWNKRTAEGFKQAILCFREALDKDPDFTRAYAGLADSYALQTSYGLGPRDELISKARAAALRALQLDSNLAEAHTSLALILEKYDYDWKGAEREFRRAIELNPNYATAHHWYAELLGSEARFDESLAEFERARRLDPLSLIIGVDRAAALIGAHQYDAAIEQLQAVRAVDINFTRSNMIILAYAGKGRFTEAFAEINRWRRITPDPNWTWWTEAAVLKMMDRPGEARKAFRNVRLNPSLDAKRRNCIAAKLGFTSKNELLACLEDAYQHHDDLSGLKTDPDYDSLRSDPRFQDLLRRAGLD